MILSEALLLGGIGVLSGFFVNLIADAAPAHDRLWPPRCAHCQGPLRPPQWSAIASIVLGRQACDYCRRARPLRWLVVEMTAIAIPFWLHLGRPGLSTAFNAGLLAMVMLVISVTDIEHRLIPHVISLPSIGLLVLGHGLDPSRGWQKTLLGAAAGFLIVWMLYLLGELFGRWIARRRGQALSEVAFGFGDVTLATALGAATGWPGIVLALMIGVLAAGGFSLLAIGWMMLRGRYQPYLPIPYGPFLMLGAALVYYGGSGLFSSWPLG